MDALTSLTDPLGAVTNMTRDARQRLTALDTAEGRATTYAYDTDGRLTSATPTTGPTRTRTYDAEGDVAAYDDGGLTGSLGRDLAGRINEMTDPLGSRRPRLVDAQGRVTAIDDPLGNRTGYAYDSRNRVSAITFPGSLGSLNLTYDANGNPLTRTYSDGTSFSYTWDAEDRLTAADGIALSYDANGDVTASNGVSITRDGFGRMTGVTYATGKNVSYTYDPAGRLATVTDWIGGTTRFTYDAAGRLIALDRPNGVRTTQARDMDGEVSMIVHGTHGSISLTRDAGGRVTQAVRVPDPLVTMDPGNVDLMYDAASQVTTRTYDAMGRLTGNGADSYTWNLASQLTAATGVTYTYDARGQLTSRTAGGVTTDYVWSYAHALPSPVIERRGGTDTAYNVFTPGGALLYRVDAATDTRVFHHFDEVGHTAMLTDEMGTVAAHYAYGPYGELLASTGSADNPFLWQGRYGVMRDANTGLSYVRARWFDHDGARFISRDTLSHAMPGAANPYSFGMRDPGIWLDVDGREPQVSLTMEPSHFRHAVREVERSRRIERLREARPAEEEPSAGDESRVWEVWRAQNRATRFRPRNTAMPSTWIERRLSRVARFLTGDGLYLYRVHDLHRDEDYITLLTPEDAREQHGRWIRQDTCRVRTRIDREQDAQAERRRRERESNPEPTGDSVLDELVEPPPPEPPADSVVDELGGIVVIA